MEFCQDSGSKTTQKQTGARQILDLKSLITFQEQAQRVQKGPKTKVHPKTGAKNNPGGSHRDGKEETKPGRYKKYINKMYKPGVTQEMNRKRTGFTKIKQEITTTQNTKPQRSYLLHTHLVVFSVKKY